jgi:hypothetical protein
MLSIKSLYGVTAMNLFILLPLLTEFLFHDWSFSFSQLAYFVCPIITVIIIMKIVQLDLLKSYHGTFNFVIQLLIGGTSIIIAFNQSG